ncbi:clavesin-1-like isoform X1 [Wyeomyia smithii]|uniref:clavesin-1-like isoform X1 n=2 Tax=Wyeomyia smithii TaxID=174621 RepID=UPI002467B8F5|nr:clavesin-1-like isoform X1 [Wyeomyia smithii]
MAAALNMCKAPESYDSYAFNLPDKFKLVAQDELREEDDIRENALKQVREWIAKHPLIKKCRTDAPFLLRFLRTKKFSIPAATEMLEKYLSIRQIYPDWFHNLDINDADLEAIIDSGYLFALPERDERGRKIVFSSAGKFDTNRFTAAQLIRIHSIVVEALLDEEESQIAGYVHVIDDSELSMGFLGIWSFADIKNLAHCVQNSLPMRQKENHFVSLPPFANKLSEFILSVLSDKLKNRVFVHKNMDELKTKINPKLLPKEYGGTVPMADCIAQFKELLKSKRDQLVALDEMQIEINKNSPYWADSSDADIAAGVIGSFRKLEVD